jgi:hypothetical protein
MFPVVPPEPVVDTVTLNALAFASDFVMNMCTYLPCVKFVMLIVLAVVDPVNVMLATL